MNSKGYVEICKVFFIFVENPFDFQSTSLNLDTERPSMSGLDDTFRPNVDGTPNTFEEDSLPLNPPKNQTSYDELRAKNRDEYAKKHQNPLYRCVWTKIRSSFSFHELFLFDYFHSPMPPQESTPVVRPTPESEDQQQVPRGAKNRYGDVWTQ